MAGHGAKQMIAKPFRSSEEASLFDDAPAWTTEWWDMPEFSMKDASPQYKITMNFLTFKDMLDFAQLVGFRATRKTDSEWFPPRAKLSGQVEYDGPPTDSRYPVCIPSKGRWDNQTTGKVLDRMGVSYRFFVEESEADQYRSAIGDDRVVQMPFSDLGQGSIPARNFIWEWALERGHKRYWCVDDNIKSFARTNFNRRLCVRGGGFFLAMEDFVDRYENIALAGPHHKGFVQDNVAIAPYTLNSRVYSCILIDASIPYRWRGRYNEDTDLSLRCLKDGYCTLLFNALCMDKAGTSSGSECGKRGMKGGNTDHVYNTNDYRLEFAKSLQRQHPDCVSVVWKYGRWHHQVDYSAFKNNKLAIKEHVVPALRVNNYGMELTHTR